MRKLMTTVYILGLSMFSMQAQVPHWIRATTEVIPGQFESTDSLNLFEAPMTDFDSLLQEKFSFDHVDVPAFEDSVYDARIKSINSVIPLTYNDQVRNFIDLYVLNRRDQVQRMIGLSQFYFPIFDEVFSRHGIPPEMRYLSIIESALNPNAVSRAGATGLWQFMYGTAKVYGLSMNSYIDERRDIFSSTEGAARYLKNMYDVYGDWLLAIASYNCGPGNVNKAIKLSGGNTFWEIAKYLPKETRGYVPAFIAATYVMNYYDSHELTAEFAPYCYDSICTVQANGKITMDQASKYLSVPVDELKFLNPGLKTNVIPHSTPYAFKIPGEKYDLFGTMHDSMVTASVNDKTRYYFGSYSGDKVVYTVRKGDNLGKIAMKYHVTVSQIKKWNGLSGTIIRPGQKLKMYPKGSNYTSNNTTTTTTNNTTTTETSTNSTTTTGTESNIIYYKVKYGDTLWDLARTYGTTISEIKALNGSAKCTNLKAGTVLKISTKG